MLGVKDKLFLKSCDCEIMGTENTRLQKLWCDQKPHMCCSPFESRTTNQLERMNLSQTLRNSFQISRKPKDMSYHYQLKSTTDVLLKRILDHIGRRYAFLHREPSQWKSHQSSSVAIVKTTIKQFTNNLVTLSTCRFWHLIAWIRFNIKCS